MIEEALGRLETRFGAAMARLQRGEQLDVQGFEAVISFAASLRVRHPAWIEHWQGTLDEVQRIYRMVDRTHNGRERFSDQFWAGSEEAGRPGAIDHVEVFARVLAESCGFLINDSATPFVTSDQAVVHDYVDWLQLARAGIPSSLLSANPRGGEALFYWAPLDPRVGLIASPHLRGAAGDVNWTHGSFLPLVLNEMVRRSSTEFLVASVPEPFGETGQVLVAAEEAGRAFLISRTGIEVVAGLERYWIATTAQRREEGEHPLISRIVIVTSDVDSLRRVADLERFDEVLEYQGGLQTGFLKGGRFLSVAIHSDGESVIQSGPGEWAV